MYITDLTHFLDASGAIGSVKVPARAMAQFHVDAVAHASDSSSQALPAPMCLIEGRISNWQGSQWDLRDRRPTSG